MGYPTAIQTFTTKQDGIDYPQAVDVNGLQTEVTAIETGLLSGFQHPIAVQVGGITQSASTGSNNFAGPSSFAGNVQVTGGSTFSSNVTIGGTLTVASLSVTTPPPAARLTNSALMAVAGNAWTGLSWNTESFNNSGMHSTASNSSRITFKHSTGLYMVGVNLEWSSQAGLNFRTTRLMFNDLTGLGAQINSSISGVGVALPQSVTTMVRAGSTTDYVTVQVFSGSASTVSINATSTQFGTVFWAHKVSG